MSLPLPRRVLCLLPLVGAASAAAQPRSLSNRELKAQRWVLPDNPSAPVPKVRVTPDFVTVLEFDAPIDPDAVAVEGKEERFALVEVTTRMVVLRLAVALAEDEQVLVTVSFADGQAPARVTLALVPATHEVDVQVRVVRRPRSVPALEAELEEVRARCEAGSFVKLVLAGELEEGVTRQKLEIELKTQDELKETQDELKVLDQVLYRARARTVVVARLWLSPGPLPWVPIEAWLRDIAGQVVQRQPVWMNGTRILPGQAHLVAVELEQLPENTSGRWSLELRERSGERHVRLSAFTLRGEP